jgi:phage terminase large subunit-like protein
MSNALQQQIDRWRRDPASFWREVLVNPETNQPFDLYPAEEVFLRKAFTLTPDGRLPYPELVFAAPKKSGKTCINGGSLIYVPVVHGGKFSEAYAVANDLEQSKGRAFQAASRITEASPLLSDSARVFVEKIEFPATGATITAIPSDFKGAAGANPNISTFDELWGYTTEASHRLWDEMVPPPTRKVACRLTTTYAGFEGESILLENLYKRGLQGKEIAPDLYELPGEMLMFWTHKPVAPWQTEEWLQQMRRQLRPNAYLRMIENRWVSSESEFIDMAWWDACVDPEARPLIADRSLEVYVGVDASTKKDSTAVAAATWDREQKKARLVYHKIFHPSKKEPIDFEVVEDTIIDLHKRFNLLACRFDPYQMVSSAQRLIKAGVRMVEFPQTSGNLTEASQTLYDSIKGRNLVAYADAEIRLAVNRAVAIEGARGWRIAKEKQSHKVDVVVAMAQAVLGAVKEGSIERKAWFWQPSDFVRPNDGIFDQSVQTMRDRNTTFYGRY